MRERRPRILLSEGSSLSSREAITALGLAGHRVEVVSSDPWCLGRFSRFVSHIHQVPSSGSDPDGYLSAVLRTVERREIDVLLPVHEQAYLFAAARHRLPPALGLALADFDDFEEVQNKARFSALLGRLGIPQPHTEIVHSDREFLAERPYPFYVKAAFGTASSGVWRIANIIERDRLLRRLDDWDTFEDGLLVQAAIEGPLERTQAVFDRGRLVASHIYRQVAEGLGGGDVLKTSVNRPEVREIVGRIGQALAWHGALSFDYILERSTGVPRFFDANPRLVEPMNAWLSGVDLTGALLDVSLGRPPAAQADGREGVLTRLGLMGLLDVARRRGSRIEIMREAGAILRGSRRYRSAIEELTPLGTDWPSAIPLAAVALGLLFSPKSGRRFSRATVSAYSLTPIAVQRVQNWRAARAAPDLMLDTGMENV